MKKIFLLIALVSLSITSAFSQTNKSSKVDSTLPDFSIYKNEKPLIQGNGNGFSSIFNGAIINGKQLLPGNSQKKSDDRNCPTIIICKRFKSCDNMPCIKPEGFFLMRIYSPNPNIRYALLNK